MHSLPRDLRYALRALRKAPAFAGIAILTLALGIGASTAIFSVVNAVLLQPLPYAKPDQLVLVWTDMRTRNVLDFPIAPGDFPDMQRGGTLFQGMAAVTTGRAPMVGEDGRPERVSTAGVTTNLFSLLGARIALGRDFVAADGTPQPAPPPGAAPGAGGAAPVQRLPAIAILSYGFWQRQFGGDPGVVGRSIHVGNAEAEVVGVLAPGFELLFPPSANIERTPDIYTALRVNYANASRINVFMRVIGRLKPGVTLARAQAQMDRVTEELDQLVPIKRSAGFDIRLEPMHKDLVADVQPAILALMGAVIFVLLIACANVANLLLVRAASRERDLAVRAALGGSQGALVRQVLAESVVLATAAALLGLGLAALGIRLLAALAPANLPRLDAIAIDPPVLLFTAVAALAATVIFGVVPALRASAPDIMSVLRTSGRGAVGQRRGSLFRNGVVMAEVALSFVLLVGSGLMVRSFIALEHVDPGFDPNGVLTFFFRNTHTRGADERAAFIRQLHDRLAALPGVQAVTAANPLPLDGGLSNARWGTEQALADPSAFQQADTHIILPGYFKAMRTRLIAGRPFSEADNAPGVKHLIIDQSLAAQAFPGRSAVGQRLLARVNSPEPEWFEVIGVVAHERHESLAHAGPEEMFLTDGAFGHGAVNRWAVRTAGDPSRVAPQVRALLTQLDPLDPVSEVQPMTAFVDRAMAPTRFALTLIGIFAAVAAILAAVGLYGVLSTVVRQRTAEIGVRMAFGAPSTRIFRLVIGQGLRLSVAGLVVGVAAALVLTRVMTSMLVGIAPTDPVTFAGMVVLFLGVAALACWLPARRAAALDPASALREE
ncbi:MAG TPA: ABC transporter permease [Gemmatimonadaceae bacterium]|nr:ABC transporter permease [Gemmatimonadaceae bacterium]